MDQRSHGASSAARSSSTFSIAMNRRPASGGMGVGIVLRNTNGRNLGANSRRGLEHGLCGLRWKMPGNIEDRVLGGIADSVDPILRDAP